MVDPLTVEIALAVFLTILYTAILSCIVVYELDELHDRLHHLQQQVDHNILLDDYTSFV